MKIATAAAAALSAVALVILVARYDLTARGPVWNQAEAERRLRSTALAFGIDASQWKVTSTAVLNPDLLRLEQREPLPVNAKPLVRAVFSPLYYAVMSHASQRDGFLLLEFSPQGTLRRLTCNRCGALYSKSIDAQTVLQMLAGSSTPQFQAKEQAGADGTSRWVWPEAQPGSPALEARISYEGGKLTGAILTADLSTVSSRRFAAPWQALSNSFRGVNVVFRGTALVIAAIYLLRRLRRREPYRLALALALFWLAAFLLTLAAQGPRWREAEHFASTQNSLGDSDWLAFQLAGRAALWLLPCVAGMYVVRGPQIRHWLGFLEAAQCWQPARRTGTELFNGLLLGWPLALAPYIAALFGGPVWSALSPRIAFEAVPVLVGLTRHTAASGDEAMFFALFVPLVLRPAESRKLRFFFLALIAIGMFGWMGYLFPVRPPLDLAAGLLFALTAVWIYRGFGLMGIFAASASCAMVTPLAWLAASPSSHMLPLLASVFVYAGALAGSRWLERRGRAGDDDDLASEIARRNESARGLVPRSEREQLRAEFAEAREAQMGMLPESAPLIDGYTVAAVCVPARDVGGDLYDFIKFPDGRWGFCVADVSGKGVPAALYMTMTKGLLASEGRFATDLKELTLALNEPLHEAGRKKTFVTLAMARLDPATGHVEIIRAGHNPLLWRRAARGETVWLQPQGLGLGLVSNKMFGRGLERQSIELEPGDVLVLYSDGLTEAENPAVELFGEDRLLHIVENGDALDAQGLVNAILADVEIFKQGADPHDDLTLLVVKR